ncbi:N-acetyltransferase [Pseudomonas aeruginosa]|nr:N-acetyltransferase [Pseudomonas aeruginosa]OZO16622.1 N-acetyltransferase [Pseudomonas aeruginosa]RPW15100.1 N-acetyltransferase [Pseudomonas aeruginosa]RUG34946.1 N-acetyltransferase [Pseudomonas aeruginosa]
MKSHKNDIRYQTYRSQARNLSMELLRGQPELLRDGIDPLQIRFEPITDEAIEASQLWGKDAELYRWEDVPSWKDKDRKGFDLSLWYGFQLCGLCYATPRKSSICIKLILLEGNPDDSHPLKGEVASLALLAIDYYARMIKCTEIEVQDPEPLVVPWYQELGFDYEEDGRLVIQVNG